MKKIVYKIAVAALLVLGVTACDSELDQVPHDNLATENAYETAQDYENAIRGAYSAFFNDGYYGGGDSGDITSLADVLGDNVILNPNGRKTKKSLYDYTFDAANASMGLYQSGYAMVYRVNLILENMELKGFDGDNKEQIQAEAHALRGIAHFDMVKFYAKIPSQGGDLGYGIPYMTEPDPKATPSRLSLEETYERIIDDLEWAYDHIETAGSDGRLSKEAVAMFLSRVYLYKGQNDEDYTKARDYAAEVTTPVASRDELADVFTDESKAGVVFYISNDNTSDAMGVSIGTTWGQGPTAERASEYNVTKSFYEMYDDDDVRKSAFMAEGYDSYGNPGIFISKYLGKGDAITGYVDLKLLRASEASLIRAEAEYELGNFGAALEALDEVRSNRYDNFTSGNESGSDLWDAIKTERRFELAFEYSRFLDLKRWEEGVHRVDEGHHLDGDGNHPVRLDVEATDHRMVLPFSQNAMDRNPNLTPNNPGYSS